MDELQIAKIQNTINEINNQVSKDYIDTPVSKLLMTRSVNQLNFLMMHIGHLEEKLNSTIESNRLFAEHAENLIAENQRLSQIAKY